MDQVRVDLAHSDERPRVRASANQVLQECSTILFDDAAGVLFGVTKVEGVSPVKPGIAALPRAEAMHQPWNPAQAFRAEDLNFVFPDFRWRRGFGWHQTILNEAQCVPADRSMTKAPVVNGSDGRKESRFAPIRPCPL
jgi:hypothetical protein